ncbi:hypothetical protein HMPREF0813_00424 [Streptococcus anginosus F0211]|uniref:Uncharacterized protein n=1 Tax=Streptococcus anginosus F0211 TaxID=706437 RepID=E6IZK9_STRAP|nr:hypothetical protein SanJ4206_0066c [Streptococcus anginosus]EFU22929.1 hypothetical protein HMPREF0813_00424 [Streptococcus anginosus F0211]EUB15452.1 hypothetical protein HMPREF1510_0465 [Streptococcus sp. ACC21]EUC76606.1 hypothetical protein HMPREF1511_1534 [Streptococcus sp. CM7]EWC99427.1 hypothetical protein HMPREF1509_0626 [Streptococcus sp. AC15]
MLADINPLQLTKSQFLYNFKKAQKTPPFSVEFREIIMKKKSF